MKKFIQIFSIAIFVVVLLLGLMYIGLAVYYEDGFSFGTYINGIYCTGKTVDEVNKELDESFQKNTVFSFTIGEETKEMELSSFDYSFDFEEPLHIYLTQQNPYLWIENLFSNYSEINLTPDGVFDEERFFKEYDKLALFENELPQTVSLKLEENGYTLLDGKTERFDEEKVKKILKDSLSKGILDINLNEMECRIPTTYSEEDNNLFSVYKLIDEFQNRDITIIFGKETRKITRMELAEVIWINENNLPSVKDDNSLKLDEEAVKELSNKIAGEYNTYGNHHFVNHSGDNVYLSKGNYGNEIDEKEEQKWLLEVLNGKETKASHEPSFLHTANHLEKDDIGNTYIEISISEQKMFYFKDGKLKLQTDVVTGNTGLKRGTPQKVCYVYGKQERRILRGPGYASFVNYWMPVSGNIGIHDAPWRSEYGGEIYKTNGSHGCINTPYDQMKELYEDVEIGTPVIIYDLDNSETF